LKTFKTQYTLNTMMKYTIHTGLTKDKTMVAIRLTQTVIPGNIS